MNELKSEDVMKALEHCANYKREEVSCIECPIRGRCFDEANLLEKAVLALLREKDAEIERLKAEMKILRCEDCWNLAQTEALIEFKKRLVEKTQLIPTVFNAHFLRLVSQVISEMKGENNDSVSESKD